jgi:chromosome segregation ATPase
MRKGIPEMSRAAQVVSYGASGTLAVVANGVAYAEGVTPGNWAVGATVVLGLASAAAVKAYTDLYKARAAAILETAKAQAEADAYRERLEMKVQSEWDDLNAHSLKGQLEQLRRAVDEDRSRTEDANHKLHELRNQAQNDILSRDAKIAELTAEVRALRDKEHEYMKWLATRQFKQNAAIKESADAISETKAAVDVIVNERAAEKSGTFPVFKPPVEPTGG